MLVHCEQCDKKFNRPPSQLKERNFCTLECYWQYLSENLTGENSPLWKGGRRVDAICQQCEKPFRPLRADTKRGFGKFCSNACYGNWLSENRSGENHPCYVGDYVELTCDWCDDSFNTRRSQAEKGHRFCSRECMGRWNSVHHQGKANPNWRGERIKKVCPTCNQVFEVRPTLADKSKFCSVDCKSKWQSEHLRGENNPGWKGGPFVKKICEVCGSEFGIYPSKNKGNWGRLCSRKCQSQWQSVYRRGKNSPNWLGGKSFEPYGVEFNKELKEKIRERENFTCALCEKRQGKQKLDVHHIDYDKSNNNPDNLIALCRRCHTGTNVNRGYWTERLTKLLGSKTDDIPPRLWIAT